MQIQYVTTRSLRTVKDAIGALLVKRGIAREYQTRAMQPEAPAVAAEVVDDDVSPRTGKTKRKYKRRDMQAEQ
jgi:hypothetical protein